MNKKQRGTVGFIFFILLFCLVLGYAQPAERDTAASVGGIEALGSAHPVSDPQGKISLDIKDMDILDVLKLLAKKSNMNIVAGKNVRGKITIFLKDVEVGDALEIILATNDLAYEKKANIINVITEQDYEALYGRKFHDKTEVKILELQYAKASDVSRTLNQIKSKIGRVVVDEGSNTIVLIDAPQSTSQMESMVWGMDVPTVTRVFTLNYGDAGEIQDKLSELLTNGVGSLRVDERMNKIIVTDLPQKVDEVGDIIAAFDEKTPEVVIDAKIVQIILADDLSLGVDWDAIFAGVDASSGSSFDIISTGSYSGSFSIGTVSENGYSGMIEALQTIAETNTLSSPRITVLNNQEAKILVGTKEAYVTSTTTQTDATATTAESVTFIDVGVALSVTPTINAHGFVTMKIKPEISSVDREIDTAKGNSIPIVRTSEAETSVMVEDGKTIVIAGLIEDKKVDTVNKVPLLGDIPVLGGIFRSKSVNIDKTELAIFLTPHIISGKCPPLFYKPRLSREREEL